MLSRGDKDLNSCIEDIIGVGNSAPAPSPIAEGYLNDQDISMQNVDVPDSFVDDIFGEPKSNLEPKPIQEAKEISGDKPDPNQLMKEFKALIVRGKELISEMTTCGMIGTNMAGPVKKKAPAKKKKVVAKKKPTKADESINDIVERVMSENR